MGKSALLLMSGLMVLLVGCDHLTKHVVQSQLKNRPRLELISGVLELKYVENRAMGFNLLHNMQPSSRHAVILTLHVIVTLAVILAWLRRRRGHILEQLTFMLILAGALGNMIDRLLRGYVIDFIHVSYWPIFNVADICISMGAVMLVVVTWRRLRRVSTG